MIAYKVDNDNAQLRWFFIESKMRGKGLGHKLMKTAMDFCKENHAYSHKYGRLFWRLRQLLILFLHSIGSFSDQGRRSRLVSSICFGISVRRNSK